MFDCIIIGAGFSGLSAARVFQEQSKAEFKIKILEASERVGGRTLTDEDGTDLGAGYVGPGQRHILRLIDILGEKIYKVNTTGKTAQCVRGVVKYYQGLIPPLSPLATLYLNDAMVLMDDLVKQVDVSNPELTPGATRLDSLTIKQWLETEVIPDPPLKKLLLGDKPPEPRQERSFGSRKSENSSLQDFIEKYVPGSTAARDARAIMELALETVMTVNCSRVSVLAAAFYIANSGGTKRIFETENGAQDSKVHGGLGALAPKLAVQLLKKDPNLIDFSSPVRHVDYSDNSSGVRIECRNSLSKEPVIYKAKKIIFAIPPIQQLKIEYSPALPSVRHQALQNWPQGHIIKTFLYYKSPFWRESGKVGAMISDAGPAVVTMDDTKPDGSQPAIMGFVPAEEASKMERLQGGPEARKDALVRQYVHILQDKRAETEVVGYKEKNWAEEQWIGGCYAANPQPQALTNFPFKKVFAAPLRFGNDTTADLAIFIAGTEVAARCIGYVDGAIESGERCARNVIASLCGAPILDEAEIPKPSIQMKEPPMEIDAAERILCRIHRKVLWPLWNVVMLVLACKIGMILLTILSF